MKTVIRYILFLFTCLLVFILYLHRDVTEEATYVTSEKCQNCHISQYTSWRENTLHPYMFLPVGHEAAKILEWAINAFEIFYHKDQSEVHIK